MDLVLALLRGRLAVAVLVVFVVATEASAAPVAPSKASQIVVVSFTDDDGVLGNNVCVGQAGTQLATLVGGGSRW